MTDALLALASGCGMIWADFAATWWRLGDLAQCLQEASLRFHSPHDVQRSLGCFRGDWKDEVEDMLFDRMALRCARKTAERHAERACDDKIC